MNRTVSPLGNQEYQCSAVSWMHSHRAEFWKGHAARMVRLKTLCSLQSTAGDQSIITVGQTEKDKKSVACFPDLRDHML